MYFSLLSLLIIFLCFCSGPKSVDKTPENTSEGYTENPQINYERPENEQVELPRAVPPGSNPVIAHAFDYPVITFPETSIEIVSVLTTSFYRYTTPPVLISDMDSLYAKISYPEISRRAGILGIVIVEFEVDTMGTVQNHKYITGIGQSIIPQFNALVSGTGDVDGACTGIYKRRTIINTICANRWADIDRPGIGE